ncbi:maternal embryonic leucine zipper kinase-like [Brevipalpus obovatus]|uniref:maternal embryonic leucine zipper kinase-like n=1 Tax=Brevipalpus obovatus TaxID=246614 RepID=UPI003D9E8CF2
MSAVKSNVKSVNEIIKTQDSVRMNCQREDYDIEAGYYFHKKKLGEGGFSKVQLATHLLTGQQVAIKCMDKTKLGEDLFRVKTEINALKILDHQHIAKLLQVIETEKMIYLVLEFCSGGELFDYIVSKSRLTEKESQEIMGSLIHCLAYIHSMGFAHRDLKPENILFDSKHRIKLIDFGLAANSTDNPTNLQHLRTCCGSPAYAAPELIRGLSYSGPAVDVWSAGVILYALLVGQLPFDDENMGNLYKKIQNGQYAVPTWLSPEAKNLVTSMIQIHPNKRTTIKNLMDDPWIRKYLPNKSNEVQKNLFDDEILWQVHKFFPTYNYTELRHNILHKFGYQTATYWLLKQKKIASENLPIRRPLLLSNSISSPARVDQKAMTATASPADRRHAVVAVKRPRPEGLENFHNSPKVSTFKPNDKASPKFTPKSEYGQKEIVTYDTSPRTPTSKIPVSVLSPTNKAPQSPMSETPNNRKRKLFSNSPSREQDKCTADKTYMTSKENFVTPAKRPAPAQTPKKSLLKKILESATPSRKHPRNITSSAPNATSNITMTNFSDPQNCIEKLMQALLAKGIECKRKGFTISCSLNNRYHQKLSFQLEVCQFGNSVALQRKRLRGDAWHYKKVCEEILRISNDICPL